MNTLEGFVILRVAEFVVLFSRDNLLIICYIIADFMENCCNLLKFYILYFLRADYVI